MNALNSKAVHCISDLSFSMDLVEVPSSNVSFLDWRLSKSSAPKRNTKAFIVKIQRKTFSVTEKLSLEETVDPELLPLV